MISREKIETSDFRNSSSIDSSGTLGTHSNGRIQHLLLRNPGKIRLLGRKTAIYFNVPSDATFSIAMPNDYTLWTVINATTEGGAQGDTDYISFNFTGGAQTAAEPYQLGDDAKAQSGAVAPIMYIDNTGNTDIKLEVKVNETLPAGLDLGANGTCGAGSCNSGTAQTGEVNISDDSAYIEMIDVLENTEYFNLTLYANVTTNVAGGMAYRTMYIRSTAT